MRVQYYIKGSCRKLGRGSFTGCVYFFKIDFQGICLDYNRVLWDSRIHTVTSSSMISIHTDFLGPIIPIINNKYLIFINCTATLLEHFHQYKIFFGFV